MIARRRWAGRTKSSCQIPESSGTAARETLERRGEGRRIRGIPVGLYTPNIPHMVVSIEGVLGGYVIKIVEPAI